MNAPVQKRQSESGQAVVLVIAALSIFLMAAIGLAIDGSDLYAQRQAAQAAADAAAQAGIMSIFDGTNTTGAHAFVATAGTTYTCTSSDPTPCYYAETLNGFNKSGDTVTYTPNPAGASVPNLSGDDPVNLLQVTVQRNVPATLMRLLGWNTIPVKASAMAAIVQVMSPVPIIVTHPTLSGAFHLGGSGSTNKIQICGGPGKSIQVNSNSSTAVTWTGNPVVDLSKAGPNDPGNCSTGTGADFGVWGGPSGADSIVSLGTTGHFDDPASRIADPLADVSPPADPTIANPQDLNPPTATLPAGSHGCPAAASGGCTLYFPGKYTDANKIKVKNNNAVFAPGIYYMYGDNFEADANGNMYYATGLTDTSSTGAPSIANCCGTGTGWGDAANTPANAGILVYMTGSGTPAATGTFSISSNSNVSLVGAPITSTYLGILFFVDRNAAAATHSLDGGGGLTLVGTIYTTSAYNNASIYQTLHFQGNAGSQTLITGEIITSVLELQGTPGIVMNLSSQPLYKVRQVALVQ